MRCLPVALPGFLIVSVLGAWTLAQQAALVPTVTLDRSVHFSAPDETDIEAQAGMYQIESAGESRLRLTPVAGGPALVIQAMTTTHTETLESPVALSVIVDEGTQHVVLLLPNKSALDAPGSLTGIRSRGGGLLQPLTALQLKQTTGERLLVPVPGAPTAPIPINPGVGATITSPTVRFQWQLSSSPSANSRYEICVAELNQPCSSPYAVNIKLSGVLLPDPLPKMPLGIGPRPGDPGFERQAGTSGTTPLYSHGVTLPFAFQGKRLQWSVIACVPNTSQTAFIGQPPENCSSSAPRPVTWMLPAPTLSLPAEDIVLPVVIRKGFEIYPASHTDILSLWYHELTQPSFVWTYPNQQGVDHFLVCISKPNVACPAQPTVQPSVVVALVRGALGFTLPQGLSPFMGQTLHWTVAACNAALGCVYQQQYRRLRIPLLIGSFISIYEVTQNAKCKNCHEMHRENATYLRHIQLGRFTRQDNPSGQVVGGMRNKCQTCHTASTGFTKFWSAPDYQRSFEQPLSYGFCSALKAEPVLSKGGVEHLRRDDLILWAVDRIPGLGRVRWQQTVDTWVNRGAPCPCDGTKGPKCDVYGQFTP